MAESVEKSEAILQELKKISKILVLVNAPTIENELSKIANTDARKKMWVLIDGKRMPQDIANMVGVSGRAVLYFLEDMAAAGFIKYSPREPPQRILDYVPPSWIDLITKERESEEKVENKSEKEESNA
jgi:predicted transcriptional regulator